MDNNSTSLKTTQATLLLLAGMFFAGFLYALACLHWPGPFRDSWEFFWLYQSLFESGLDKKSFSTLIYPYGGAHRLALTHLILSADWQWFGGYNYLALLVSFVCQLGLLLGSWFCLKKYGGTEFSRGLLALLVIILFNQSVVFSYLYSFNVQLFLAGFFLWLACYCFYQGKGGKLAWLLLLVPCCFSHFFSVAAVLVPGFYFLFRKNWPVSLGCFVLAAIAFYLYLPQGDGGIVQDKDISAIEATKFLGLIFLNYCHFVLRYFSAPLSLHAAIPAMVISVCALLFVIYFFIYRLFSKKVFSNYVDICLTLCLITIFVAFTSAFGRFNPMEAMAERYQPVVVFFWFVFLQLVFITQHSGFIKIVLSLLALSVFIPTQGKIIDDNIFLSNKTALANHAANMGFTHKDVARPVLSFPLNRMGLNPLKDFNSLIASEKKSYYKKIEDNSRKDFPCPMKISKPQKLVLSKIFKNTQYQWYEANLGDDYKFGNFSILINEGIYPARLNRESLTNNKSRKLFFIAPIGFDKNSSLAYFQAPGQTCVIEYD